MKKLSNVTFNIENIPDGSGLNQDNILFYEGVPPYRRYEYFGDCKNTVDKDNIWDASQMAQFIETCQIVDINMVIDKLYRGDRNMPVKFQKQIQRLQQINKLNDLGEVVCALDDHQKIMFIYLNKYDPHYFFDCFR